MRASASIVAIALAMTNFLAAAQYGEYGPFTHSSYQVWVGPGTCANEPKWTIDLPLGECGCFDDYHGCWKFSCPDDGSAPSAYYYYLDTTCSGPGWSTTFTSRECRHSVGVSSLHTCLQDNETAPGFDGRLLRELKPKMRRGNVRPHAANLNKK